MNTKEFVVMPTSYGKMTKRQEIIQSRALDLLNMIHNTSGSSTQSDPSFDENENNFELPLLFNTHLLDFSKDNALIFGGRCVISVDHISPLKVSRRILKPQLTSDGYFRPNPERIVQRLFGILDLRHLLLLITPTIAVRRQANEHVLHGFEVATQLHLGVTILTSKERELIELQHNASNYALIFCSGYIDLEDLYLKTPIKDQIFNVLHQKPTKAVCVSNGESRIILHYRCCAEERAMSLVQPRELSAAYLSSSSASSSNCLRQIGGEVEIPPPVEDKPKKKRKLVKRVKQKKTSASSQSKLSKKKPKKLPEKTELNFTFSPLDRSESKHSEVSTLKKRKLKLKPKSMRIAPLSKGLSPTERKQHAETFDKEKLRLLERKWNGFGNSDSKRRDILTSKRP
ncbi:uncharacterized protein LOC133848305 [Drosophila sulfurigaster albostrigata]|uniref:uncharacterized protein LOC133848305 n=1 Tax=Drosophila sulfurigaster albostrigata TaxID=89887 RepID=UPI002D219259|nr:uncharacterized protein LOC133848305 [Drosophila sulfurigaster albostrigata]